MNTAGVNSLLLQLALSLLVASVTLADDQASNLAAKSPGPTKEGETIRPPLYIRTFRLAPSVPWLSPDAARAESSSDVIYGYLLKRGIDLAKAEGRQLFFNDRTGLLLVRATLAELDEIDDALKGRDFAVHQVLIETRIAEIREIEKIAVGFDWYLGSLMGNPGGTNVKSAAIAVLTEDQFRLLIRVLEQREDVDLISTPKITSAGGRQVRIQTVSPQPVVTIPPFTAPGKEAKATWTRNPTSPETE